MIRYKSLFLEADNATDANPSSENEKDTENKEILKYFPEKGWPNVTGYERPVLQFFMKTLAKEAKVDDLKNLKVRYKKTGQDYMFIFPDIKGTTQLIKRLTNVTRKYANDVNLAFFNSKDPQFLSMSDEDKGNGEADFSFLLKERSRPEINLAKKTSKTIEDKYGLARHKGLIARLKAGWEAYHKADKYGKKDAVLTALKLNPNTGTEETTQGLSLVTDDIDNLVNLYKMSPSPKLIEENPEVFDIKKSWLDNTKILIQELLDSLTQATNKKAIKDPNAKIHVGPLGLEWSLNRRYRNKQVTSIDMDELTQEVRNSLRQYLDKIIPESSFEMHKKEDKDLKSAITVLNIENFSWEETEEQKQHTQETNPQQEEPEQEPNNKNNPKSEPSKQPATTAPATASSGNTSGQPAKESFKSRYKVLYEADQVEVKEITFKIMPAKAVGVNLFGIKKFGQLLSPKRIFKRSNLLAKAAYVITPKSIYNWFFTGRLYVTEGVESKYHTYGAWPDGKPKEIIDNISKITGIKINFSQNNLIQKRVLSQDKEGE